MSLTSSSIEHDRGVHAIGPQPSFASDNPVTTRHTDRPIGCHSETMRRVLAQVHQVAMTPATVLLLGETGVGKDILAQAIHEASPRRGRLVVSVSCAAIPATATSPLLTPVALASERMVS